MSVLVAQSCLFLGNPLDCSPPGSSVHGILQARILEWSPCPPPGGLPDPGMTSCSLHCISSMDLGLSKLEEVLDDREAGVLQSMGSQGRTGLSDRVPAARPQILYHLSRQGSPRERYRSFKIYKVEKWTASLRKSQIRFHKAK